MQRLLRQDLVGRVELPGHDVGVDARGELHQQVVEHAHGLDRRGPRVLKSFRIKIKTALIKQIDQLDNYTCFEECELCDIFTFVRYFALAVSSLSLVVSLSELPAKITRTMSAFVR